MRACCLIKPRSKLKREDRYDYLATKTGAIIVPSCGMDSIPSDVTAFLANKALKAHGKLELPVNNNVQLII